MERVISSLDDKVDYFLHRISVAPNLTLHPRDLYEVPVLDAETYLLDQVMLEKGLLKLSKDARVISAKGLEIANFGGWLAYRRQLRKEGLNKETKPESEVKLVQALAQLQKDNQSLKDELKHSREKEMAAIRIIQNLVQQNRVTKVLLLLAGLSLGFVLANLKSILLLF